MSLISCSVVSQQVYVLILLLQALLYRNPKNLREMNGQISHYITLAHFLKFPAVVGVLDPRIPALLCALACGAAIRPLLDLNLGTHGLLLRYRSDNILHNSNVG